MPIKIKITKHGHLKMQRRGNWQIMICPFTGDGSHCGDWCPLFNYRETVTPSDGENHILRELLLCRMRYLISEIEYE